MEKVYIVTAKDASEAVKKIKALRKKESCDEKACDEPVIYPDENTMAYFVKLTKNKANKLDLEKIKTEPNDLLADIERLAYDLEDESIVGNIWWDMKKVIEHNEPEKLNDVIKSYEDMIAVHKDLVEKIRAVAKDVTDKEIKSKFEKYIAWYEGKIDKAEENLKYNIPFAHEKIAAKEKAAKAKAAKEKAIAEAKAAK